MDSTIKAKLRDKIKKLGAEKEELKMTCEVNGIKSTVPPLDRLMMM